MQERKSNFVNVMKSNFVDGMKSNFVDVMKSNFVDELNDLKSGRGDPQGMRTRSKGFVSPPPPVKSLDQGRWQKKWEGGGCKSGIF